jgi:hypothetical protein
MQETNLYTVTIPPMVKTLKALSGILDKAKAHAETKKLSWMDFEEALMNDRIIFDQFDFKRQVQIACDNAKGIAARLAEVEIPKHEDTEKTVAELKSRIDKTLAFVATIKPEHIIGKESVKITLPFMPDKVMTGFDYATMFLLPNFYFHSTTAYQILRKNGLALSKQDFMGEVPMTTKE